MAETNVPTGLSECGKAIKSKAIALWGKIASALPTKKKGSGHTGKKAARQSADLWNNTLTGARAYLSSQNIPTIDTDTISRLLLENVTKAAFGVVNSTIDGVASSVTRPLSDMGIDNACVDTRAIVKSIDNSLDKFKGEQKKLLQKIKGSSKKIQDESKKIDTANKAQARAEQLKFTDEELDEEFG